jgi:hypothetical protein
MLCLEHLSINIPANQVNSRQHSLRESPLTISASIAFPQSFLPFIAAVIHHFLPHFLIQFAFILLDLSIPGAVGDFASNF